MPGPAGRGFPAEPVQSIPGNVRSAARLMYAGAVLDAIGPLYYGFATSPSTAPQIWHVDNPNTSAYGARLRPWRSVYRGRRRWRVAVDGLGGQTRQELGAHNLGCAGRSGGAPLVGRPGLEPASIVTLSWALSWLAGLGAIILVFQRSAGAFFASDGGPPRR